MLARQIVTVFVKDNVVVGIKKPHKCPYIFGLVTPLGGIYPEEIAEDVLAKTWP